MTLSKLAAAAHVETIKHRAAIKKLVFKGSWNEKAKTETGWKRDASSNDAICEVHYTDGTLQTHSGTASQIVERDGEDYIFNTEGKVTKPS